MRSPRRAWLLLLALAVAGCASVGRRPVEPPEVFLVGVEPLETGAFEQRFRINLRVQNPNDFDVEVDGIDLELELNDTRLTRGLSNEEVTLPRLGEARMSVEATTTLLDLFRQIGSVGSRRELAYRIQGRLYLADSADSVPFEQSGSLLP